VDNETGDRLPFSTISWYENGQLKGVSASQTGTFSLETFSSQEYLTLTTTYVGYESRSITISIDQQNSLNDLTIRLTSKSYLGNEIIVYGHFFMNTRDSLMSGLVHTDRFSPLGDGNAIRALQVLPSVQMTTALNDGLSIRGSAPDGFQLELDGITIFNQSHLFGLVDSFNEDAVRNSGFYYGVAPAHINLPVGGMLSLTTKNGSLNKFQSNISLSNTSIRTTLEGPIRSGVSSWLISGRLSTMNEIDWLHNDKLIQWGLDVNRPNSESNTDQFISSNLITPKESAARFFDLHGKYYHESADASRTIVSGYFGGDKTSNKADRITRTNSLRDRFSVIEVESQNKWNNFAASVQHQREINLSIYSHTMAGISAYETSFLKDDFIYTETIRSDNTDQTIVSASPMINRSTMNQVKFNQTFDIDLSPIFVKTGLSSTYFRNEYLEKSFDRPLFFSRTASMLTDLFLHLDWNVHPFLDLSTGIRSNYFSNGRYLYLSPRFKVFLFPQKRISFYTGYSENVQFMNRISFSNAVTADIWILANKDQSPTISKQIMAGLTIEPISGLFMQTEIYRKEFENLRLHELNTSSLANSFEVTPWFYQNRGYAQGLEILTRYKHQYFNLTQTYTRSSVELQNDVLNDGARFYAPWDRTHSTNSLIEIHLNSQLSLFASYTFASGTVYMHPNSQDSNSMSRLPNTKRLDLSLLFTGHIKKSTISTKISVFNVLDRNNVWYREIQPIIESQQTIPSIRPIEVDVYDLGIQPSFEIKFTF
ncbi:MAG: carboxypeptidase-like regulatory domain-containing protein, partial [Balneolaceae bacterium]